MRIFCLVLGVSLAVSASHARLTPQIAVLTAGINILHTIAPSAALPTTNDLNNVVLEQSNRMEKSLQKKQRMNYEDDEFEETAHGLMSDSGSSVKSYVVQRPEGEEEEQEVKRVKKSKRKQHEDSEEVEEEEEQDDLERKDTKAADVKYTYDPEYLEQGYLLPVAVKKGKKDRKDVKKKNKKKFEEDSEEEAHDDKKRKKDEESEEEEEEADEEAEDEEEADEPQGGGQGGQIGNKKQDPPPKELLQTLLNTYGFIPEQLQQGAQQGQQGGRPQHGGYSGGPGGPPRGPGGPPGGPHGGPHGGPYDGPDGPHYDFPPSRTPGAKYENFGTPPPESGNYPHPPQNFGPSSQEQPQPSLVGSILSRLNPFAKRDQEYAGGPNGPPQYGPPNGQGYNGPPQGYNGPPQGQYNGPPQGQYNGPPQGQFNGPPQGHRQENPPRGPPKRKHKNRKHEEEPQHDENYDHPYNYEPEPSASEIRVQPIMSRLQSVFGMGQKSQNKDPFISVRY